MTFVDCITLKGLAKKLAKLIVQMKVKHWDEGLSRVPSHIRRKIIDGIIDPPPPLSLSCSPLLPLLFDDPCIFQNSSRIGLDDADLDFSIPPPTPDDASQNEAGSPIRLQAMPPHRLPSSANVNDLNSLLSKDEVVPNPHTRMRNHSSAGAASYSPPPTMHHHGKLSRVILGTVGKVFRVGRHRQSSGLPLKEEGFSDEDLMLDADGNLVKITEDERATSSYDSVNAHLHNPPSVFLTSDAPSTPSLTDVSETLGSGSTYIEEVCNLLWCVVKL